MANTVYIAQSLDGYIADIDGNIDWLQAIPNPENSDFGWVEFLARIDAVVMGKNTFEKILSFECPWAYPLPVFVLSTSMKSIPAGYENKIELISATPREVIKFIEAKGYKNLYIDGGVTIQSFLKEDMIDELIITTLPILLGDGYSLFGKLDIQLQFKHVKTEILLGEMIKSTYKRSR